MQFEMSIKNSRGKRFGWGHANPISIGDKIAPRNQYFRPYSSPRTEKAKDKAKPLQPLNISYQMSLTSFNASSKEHTYVQISAEGIYDGETGVLCMVGCKYLDPNNQILANDSMDCEILVNVQLSPFDSNQYIKGRIESTRESSSPLYFEPFSFSAVPYYRRINSIRRMDLEITMALISNALISVFVGYQIFYVKKHPNVFPFISLLMLVVLTVGRMIPLVLNFEALFLPKQNTQSFLVSGGGWVEVNEVMVKVVTMVAFMLQFRFLQLVWSARLADGNQKASWVAEKKALYVSLPLYIAGGLIALFMNCWNCKLGKEMDSPSFYRNQHSLWPNIRSYAGLVLDGFLFPQILLNFFHNSRENALSCFFYIGTTFVRLLPHAYDLYKAHFYVDDFDWSYIYADPSADYYSAAWDMIIPLGGLLFAAIIYLQQKKGGRCFLPKRFKELEGYEKVPVVDNP
ncbi:hypothetical protein P3X46_034069 [Hevea brasiliensis]|uniref:RING-type E3 ubiquitin transferase n=1 Tax=Hevea brasiliensis TaxID=3981 RepID=A0ABQ9K8Y0_HEVBR|nr:uncharacterized protein LOC131176691 [Hevea brasiliensis]KAJ9129144.1 hypothetical protein P3X46_034069 [Hevea brasiliensis]